jgi:hypothetical protein
MDGWMDWWMNNQAGIAICDGVVEFKLGVEMFYKHNS